MTNKSYFGRLMLLGLCLVISGCIQATRVITPATVPLASEQADEEAKRFKPQPGKASIYVMRKDAFAGQAVLFQVSLDGKEQGELSRGTYFLFTVTPGKHVVDFAQTGGADPGRGMETIYAVAGGIFYLEIRPKSGITAPPTRIYRIDQERGRRMVLEGRRAEIKAAE